jgi:periplasmic protein TonB
VKDRIEMAEIAVEPGGAVSGKGTLWAKVDNESKNTITFKKAFFFALWIEAAMIAAFFSVDFEKRWDDIRDAKIMQAVAVDVPKPPEEKKPEPPPPKIKKEEPKENAQEAAPIPVEAPLATSGSSTGVSIPQAVGDVEQGKGEMTEAPPRTAASITNKKECYSSFAYPRELRRAGTEGEVLALVTVGPDGRATNVIIKQSKPLHVFDRTVISTIINVCRFAPDPVGYQSLVTITFKLAGEE